MGTWWYRVVGVAGGFLLLGGGAGHAAEAPAPTVTDPQPLAGLLDDVIRPADSGLAGLGSRPATVPTAAGAASAVADAGAAGPVAADPLPATPAASIVDAPPVDPAGPAPVDPLGLDSRLADVAAADLVPALIGDAMSAQRPELFGGMPLLRDVTGPGTARSAPPVRPAADPATAADGRVFSRVDRPIAGVDPDYR